MKLYAKEKSIYMAKYGISVLLYWVIYFILVSIISFFHFRLGHKLIVIENWLHDFSWHLLVVARILGYLSSVYLFSDLKIRDIKGQLSFDWYNGINLTTYLMSFATLIFFLIFIKPVSADNVLFSFSSTIFHSLLIFIFFFFEFLNSKVFVKSRRVGKSWHILWESACLYASLFVLYPRNLSLETGHYILLLLAYLHLYIVNYSVLKGMIFISVVIIPLFAFLGHDPLWSSEFSLFASSLHKLLVPCTSIFIVSYSYYFYLKKKGEL